MCEVKLGWPPERLYPPCDSADVLKTLERFEEESRKVIITIGSKRDTASILDDREFVSELRASIGEYERGDTIPWGEVKDTLDV